MPTLANAQGRDFVPNIAAAFDKTVLGFEKAALQEKAAEKEFDIKTQMEILADPGFSADQKKEAKIRLAQLDPVALKAVDDTLKTGNELEIAKANKIATDGLRNATSVLQQKDPVKMKTAWRQVILEKIQNNEDTDEAFKILQLPDDEFRMRMQKMVTMGTDIKTLTTPVVPKAPETRTFNDGDEEVTEQFDPSTGGFFEVGRAPRFKDEGPQFPPSRTFSEGLETVTETLNPDGSKTVVRAPRFQPEKKGDKFVDLKDGKGNLIGQRNSRTNEFKPIKGKGGGADALKKFSKGQGFLKEKDGKSFTVTSVLDQTTGEIKNVVTPVAEGEFVSKLGESAQEKRDADVRTELQKQQGIKNIDLEMEPKIKGAVVSVEQRMDASKKAFDRLPALNKDIDLYDRAIDAVKRGAGTGPVENLMPTFRAATFELQNIQQQLGLNLLSTVTMGALSENEMKILLSTSIPTGLDGPDLVEWLQSRKTATVKLRDFTEGAVQYFADPEHTLAGFVAKNRRERGKAEKENGGQANARPSTPAPKQQSTQQQPPAKVGRFTVKVK